MYDIIFKGQKKIVILKNQIKPLQQGVPTK
jgi:hypothetical protein